MCMRTLLRVLVWSVLPGVLLTHGPQQARAWQGADVPRALAGMEVVDLSVLLSEELPSHWPTHVRLQRWTFSWFTPERGSYDGLARPSRGAYYGQRYVIDEHMGTQIDFPPHFIPPPGSGLPNAGPAGALVGEHYPLEDLMGPAAVIDVRSLAGQSAPGTSPRITVRHIETWEARYGRIQPGEVVLFFSGHSDRYYKPFPEGDQYAYNALILQSVPGWPAPTPEVMDLLHGRGVKHLGTDGPSMGYVDGGEATHVAGLRHGMTWTESLTRLGLLPARGAYFISLPLKMVDSGGAPTRAMAWKPRSERGLGE